jgi:superoxide dismutase, Cu-Zn family
MPARAMWRFVLPALVLAACTHGAAKTAATPALMAGATLVDSAGKSAGTAAFRETPNGVSIDVRVTGLKPGAHGIHLHTAGKCDPAAFTTAGGHFNPATMKHGLQAQGGPHAGDLPNLTADANGSAHYLTTTNRVTLGSGATSLFDADGSALVIHAGPDDNVTDPAGNSGPRVLCGVITRVTS